MKKQSLRRLHLQWYVEALLLQVYRQHHIKQLVESPVPIQWQLVRDRDQLMNMPSLVKLVEVFLRRLKIPFCGMIVIKVLM